MQIEKKNKFIFVENISTSSHELSYTSIESALLSALTVSTSTNQIDFCY